MPQMGVDVPDEVMVALSERRISLLLDHQAGQLVQPGQATTSLMMYMVLSVSDELTPVDISRRTHWHLLAGLTWKPVGSAAV